MLESIELLVGGRQAFDCILDNIQRATKQIKINMFVWRDDSIGNDMARALIEAANRGVKIYISKDRLGMLFECGEEHKHSFFHHNHLTRWYVQSIILDKVYPMEGKVKKIEREVNPNYIAMINHNNIIIDEQRVKMDHSKYYIFDNKILILGGINIEDKEVSTDVSGRAYHDYMVEIQNSKIISLFKQRVYGNELYDSNRDVEFLFNRVKCGKKDFQVKANLIELLNSAKESVDIVMAYIGDRDINDCIEQLIHRGIRVTLYLPDKANLQHDLNMKNLKELMIKTNNQINVYLTQEMIHAKLIRIDYNKMTVGSTNLNKQAMEVLLELNVMINNRTKRQDLAEVFLKLEQSLNDLREKAKKIDDYNQINYIKAKAFLEGLA